MNTTKIQGRHLERPAYIYIRQSTKAQVLHHQQSTERQYALKDKAVGLGWPEQKTRILDRDLGSSGAQVSGRKDFKRLLADVSLGQVGAVFALEASRLARSDLQWHRLIEICALSKTLVIDEDGCYDPADFNDALLLGLKATIAQAELHFMRERLQGGKRNKANKGELRIPLPVGLCYDDQGRTILDPDRQVQGAVRLLFRIFRKTGAAYQVAQYFLGQGITFPKRVCGGAWDGKLVWEPLTVGRVLKVLKNPSYAGAYVHGRYQAVKEIGPDGEVHSRPREMPLDAWRVVLKDHHTGYISWQEYLKNRQILARNCNGWPREDSILSGPAREGAALLQGLLICGKCGRRLLVSYRTERGVQPVYRCNWQVRAGLSSSVCMSVPGRVVDPAVSKRVLEVLRPQQLTLAVEAVEELENRDEAVCTQWRMRLERAEYEAQLAERRYLEVDPSNRLVASTLESRWNEALSELEQLKGEYEQFRRQHLRIATPEQKERVLALATDLPRLWNASTTQAKDKKRMLRLLIKDITVERNQQAKEVVLHIRWQGGSSEDLRVHVPGSNSEQTEYSKQLVEEIRILAEEHSDEQIALILTEKGRVSPTGKPLTKKRISSIRNNHKIPARRLKGPEELSVPQVSEKFGVSQGLVYQWIERGVIKARRVTRAYWITLDGAKEKELFELVRTSPRILGRQGTRST